VILWNLRWVENRMSRMRQATLLLSFDVNAPEEETVWKMVRDSGVQIVSWGVEYGGEQQLRKVETILKWKTKSTVPRPPSLTWLLARQPGIDSVVWKP